jgi:hypothetical protein
MRALSELIDEEDSAWPLVQQWIAEASVDVEIGDDPGQIYYYSPDSLGWERCELTYSQFIVWAMSGKLDEFYERFRWQGWETETSQLTGDEVLSVFRFCGPRVRRSGNAIGDRWTFLNTILCRLTFSGNFPRKCTEFVYRQVLPRSTKNGLNESYHHSGCNRT